jgi:hypothetical protein
LVEPKALDSTIIEKKSHTFSEGRRCIAAGTKVEWSRVQHRESYDLAVQYPFGTYSYRINGIELGKGPGLVTIEVEVSVPEFAPDLYVFVERKKARRQVAIAFRRERRQEDPQIEHIIVENDPDAGNFSCVVDIALMLPNGISMPIGTRQLAFAGQSIELPDGFREGVLKCLTPSTGDKYKLPNLYDPEEVWGPTGLLRRYNRVLDHVQAISMVRRFDEDTLATIKKEVAVQLGIKATTS